MDSIRVPLRQGFESQLIRIYLKFIVPNKASNLIDRLESKYLFVDTPGYDEFRSAYDYEYRQQGYDLARQKYESACEKGHPLANYCYALWFLYGDRPNTEKDLKKAFQKLCVAHKFSIGQATYQLADFYRTGKGKVVQRDVKKSFQFLLQSILDPRIHLLLDPVPFTMLGLAYGLGRGPSSVSISDFNRCLERASKYVYFQKMIDYDPTSMSTMMTTIEMEFYRLNQWAMVLCQCDQDEIRRQMKLRLDAIEEYLQELPAGRSMMSLIEFTSMAKQFGLDFDDYLNGLDKGKRIKRMTWKSFRRQTDGRARTMQFYERQIEVERLPPMEPADQEDVRNYLMDLEARCQATQDHYVMPDDDYGYQFYENENNGEFNNGNLAVEEGFENDDHREWVKRGNLPESDFDAGYSGGLMDGEFLIDTGDQICNGDDLKDVMPKNDESEVIIDAHEKDIP